MTSTEKTILVLGGTSDMARATAITFATNGWMVKLAGRDLEELQREAEDIGARGGRAVTIHKFDVLDTSSFAGFIEELPVLPDAVISFVGLLGDQARAEKDPVHAAQIMRTNYEGPASILGLFAERFLKRGSGAIIGVSSVAGDRGRGSNYVYGSAKAGLTAFLSGLRNRSARGGVHVMTVKPGFVRTKMTEHMTLPNALTGQPAEIGEAIFKGLKLGKNVIYTKSIWFYIMLVIRMIPEVLFKKLKL
jgi:decaprenylphospho-beta-D-erythro-pentofuranosid-2-ulose 2-reductase